MFLKKETEYAIHGLMDLAVEREGFVDVDKIADRRHISAALMAKAFKKLVKAGILDSRFGPAGGFRLKKDPINVTLLDIVAATQQKNLIKCYNGNAPYCPESNCTLKCTITKMEHYLDEFLKNTTLSSLID